MKILVTGGAGYIGSHMVLTLLENGHTPVVIDDLSTGLAFFARHAPFHIINLNNSKKLNRLFKKESFDMVMHFAASIIVNESVKMPEKYYQNNFFNTLNLLEIMRHHSVKKIIFSSTAAIFGEPFDRLIKENHPKNPLNPYGASKLMCEQLLQDYAKAYHIHSVSLRYFNASGADPKGRTGYRTKQATHLIPAVLQTALGKRKQLEVFGRNYPTPDGTCVRDYIHVMDLCDAHLLAMQFLSQHNKNRVYNLGNGNGYSVQQLIETASQVTGKVIPYVDAPPRAGDPAALVADATRIQKDLNWRPRYPDLTTILQHAWLWEQQCSEKYIATY